MDSVLDARSYVGRLPRTGGILNLSPDEALEWLSRGAVLVDLREAYETNYRIFAVENVLYLPWSQFQMGSAGLPKNRPLILADAAGLYGKEAARILLANGWINLANLVGGMIDWDAEGLPVRKDIEYELGGQCACKIKTRHGGNPQARKNPSS